MNRSIRFPILLMIGFAIGSILATAIPGCAANPVSAAKGADEKAYAVIGSYQIYQGQALKVVQDQSLPTGVRKAAADSDAIAFPILKSLNETLATFLSVRDALDAGTTSEEKFAIALANLKDWTAKGKKAVDDIKTALANAKKVARPTASTATPFNSLMYGSA